MVFLYAFSGLAAQPGGIEHAARQHSGVSAGKVTFVMCDLANSPIFDLADQDRFDRLLLDVRRGHYHGCLASPPCGTFSRARGQPGGPAPLRGTEGPDRYGFQQLRPKDRELVRLTTLLAVRACQLAQAFAELGLPWLIENPAADDHEVSIFKLDEYQRLLSANFHVRNRIVQCAFGAASSKPTFFIGSVEIEGNGQACLHSKQWWRVPPSGRWVYAAHGPLQGRRHAVLAAEWDPAVHAVPTSPDTPFITRAAAAYPFALNLALVKALTGAVTARRRAATAQPSHRPAILVPSHAVQPPPPAPPAQPPGQPLGPAHFVKRGRWGNQLVRGGAAQEDLPPAGPVQIQWAAPLRGDAGVPQSRGQSGSTYLGGLRKATSAAAKLPVARDIGRQIKHLLQSELEANPVLLARCIDAIGSVDPDAGPTDQDLSIARRKLGALLNTTETDPLDSREHDCTLCAGLLAAWAGAAQDPDVAVPRWLREGAPAGITSHPQACGIFPPAEEDAGIVELEDMTFENPEHRQSYQGVEECDYAMEEIQRLTDKGFLLRCDSLASCREALGGADPIVSKFGQIIKIRDNGDVKRRLILDSKESGITPCARKNERIILPNVSDLIYDTLDTMARGLPALWMVLDVSDAFWSLPLRASERRFFVGKMRGKYYIFRRLAQGSRGAPLAWCRFMALVTRLTQALFSEDECRLEVYVDDPAAVLGGSAVRQDLTAATLVLAWRVLNIALAFKKGQRSRSIEWIGFQLVVKDEHPLKAVFVTLKRDTQEGIQAFVTEFLSGNTIGVRHLRSFCGKLANCARLLTAWRPFMTDFWAALAEAERSGDALIWTKQVRPALLWFDAFLHNETAGVTRQYSLASYMKPASSTTITVDASPWGLGAFVSIDGDIKQWFAIELEDADFDKFGFKKGDAAGQQTWECLAALVAMRLWQTLWRHERSAVQIRGDNMTLLTMITELRGSGAGTNKLAREFALDVAAASYRPLLATHVPGVANVIADQLSRRFAPGTSWRVPAGLERARESAPPPRTETWYRASEAPRSARHWAEGGEQGPPKRKRGPRARQLLGRRR